MTADTHEVAVARLREAYATVPAGTPVRLASTRSPTRARAAASAGSAATASNGIPATGQHASLAQTYDQ